LYTEPILSPNAFMLPRFKMQPHEKTNQLFLEILEDNLGYKIADCCKPGLDFN